MRELLILVTHLPVTFANLLRPSGVRAVTAASKLWKNQLLTSNRSRQRAPNLTSTDRCVLGLSTQLVSPHRIAKLPSCKTLCAFEPTKIRLDHCHTGSCARRN